MMELSLKSKAIKKRHKKNKLNVSDSSLKPIVKPEAFDGVCNWLKMQKVLGPVTEVKAKNQPDDKTKIFGTKQSSKGHKASYTHKDNHHSELKHNSSLQANKTENMTHNKNVNTVSVFRSYSSVVSNGPSDSVPKKSGSEQYSFNFTESKNTHMSASSDHVKSNQSHGNTEKHKNTHMSASSDHVKSNQSHGNTEKQLTKAVAMDCEMVGVGLNGDESMIARVSIVNAYGDCLYDEFVKPKEKVTDYRTQISGVRASDLKKGLDLLQVQKDVLEIIEGRILVGHSVKHDLDVLFISHPRQLIRDTAYYKPFRDLCGGRTPSLKKLTATILGCEIQSGEHSSVEDAQATMLLYLRQKHEWERLVKSQRKRKPKLVNINQYTNS